MPTNNRVDLKIASVAKETGALLKTYLMERGLVIDKTNPIKISYGVPGEDRKGWLNANVGGGDKILRLKQMQAGGVRTVPWFEGTMIPAGFKFPALARAIAGHGGEDIIPVFQPYEVPWRIAAGFAWFSSYVPFSTEYRAWIFRGEILDIYEKVMERPEEYVHNTSRNFRNGFEFKKVTNSLNVPDDVTTQACKALKAVDFDFAAADMLHGEDGKIYILELNTAIGAIRSGCTDTLGKLADRMVAWVQAGTPERNY